MRRICDIRNTRYLYIDKSGTHFHEKRKKLNTFNIWPTFISIFCDNPTAKHSGTSIWKKMASDSESGSEYEVRH